jgi:hypothetical protein
MRVSQELCLLLRSCCQLGLPKNRMELQPFKSPHEVLTYADVC